MGINIVYRYTFVQLQPFGIHENQICLPNEEYLNDHRCERTDMVAKCRIFVAVSKYLKFVCNNKYDCQRRNKQSYYWSEIMHIAVKIIPNPWIKRYVSDVISIIKKNQLDTFFNPLNSVDPHIKFTMESPDTDDSIPLLDKFVTKILQEYCGNNFAFFKDSKGLAESLKEHKVLPDVILVSFDVSALSTSILVPVALEEINRKFMEHTDKKGTEHFMEKNLFHAWGQSHLSFGISY